MSALQLGRNCLVVDFAGCVSNDVLFVSGGYRGPFRGHLDNLWKYTAESDEWIELNRMRHARSYHVMFATNDNQIIVCGGVNYLTESEDFEDVKVTEVFLLLSVLGTVIQSGNVRKL